jgi:4-amino-4-deoxy-L-arabinose transferase-like glycosyltransferase
MSLRDYPVGSIRPDRLFARKPDAVILLLAGYFLLEFFVRLAMPQGLRYDESQQAFFSQWLALGYDSQPPLYNWVNATVVALFGLSVATLAFVKNAALFLVYVSYYKLARLVLKDKFFAAIATLSLFAIPQLSWEAQRDLTHTVAELLTVNLFLHAVIRTLKAPDIASYFLMGVALGLGMLSKYNFVLVPAAALVAVWFHPQGRSRIFDKRFLMTITVGLLIFLPHGLWLVHNLDLASGRTLGIMAQNAPASAISKFSAGPLKFVKLVILMGAPTLLLYALVFRGSFLKNLKQSDEWTRFFEIFAAVLALSVLALIVAVGMTDLRDRWLLPFLLPLPIYLCLKMEAAGVNPDAFAKRFIYIPLALMLLIPAALLVRVTLPHWFKSYEAYNVPYDSFVEQVVASEGKQPGLAVTDDWLPAGNLKLQLPTVPVMSRFFANLETGYEWSRNRPILLVWLPEKDNGAMPATLVEWLRSAVGPRYEGSTVRRADVSYANGEAGSAVTFAYSWIYPK